MSSMSRDRRSSIRYSRPEDHRIVRARVRPAFDVTVVDVSAGGALVETTHRLMPGGCVELHLRRDPPDAQVVRCRVLRCRVARVTANTVAYLGAVAFDRPLPWFAEGETHGYSVPVTNHRVDSPVRAVATHQPG